MPHEVENSCVTPVSPKTLLIAYLTETLSGSQRYNAYFVCHTCYTLYSYNTGSWRKENVSKKIVRENTCKVQSVKNPHMSQPAQFKSVLVEAQLHIQEVVQLSLFQFLNIFIIPQRKLYTH